MQPGDLSINCQLLNMIFVNGFQYRIQPVLPERGKDKTTGRVITHATCCKKFF